MELVLANIQYVVFRLLISAPIVSVLMRYLPYYVSVIILAQISFLYDLLVFYFYFDNPISSTSSIIIADISYTLRVIAAWWLIKKLWDLTDNYILSVFIGAEITFVIDYFIYSGVYT